MKHFYIFWLNSFVFAGQSVVDKTTVEEGQTFTITCDHLHVNGTIPSCRFSMLDVYELTVDGITQNIISLSDGEISNVHIPSHWTKDCKNPKHDYDSTHYQCKLIVNDAKVSDSGQYGCEISVYCMEGDTITLAGVSKIAVTKDSTRKSEASINFGEKTTIGLCLMMIAATQL
ncbi:unnamed protein product [Lymnaea stagnalis]|uniref:Ig-like domain-containing protein n=1 Tax=Lymnaea stagnalis TaxID=6523 RepID=A0AAV2HDL4_LYMST